ncbi:MAG: hypothetical protein WD733_08435 [Bryobacterales bacterium]
MFPRTRAVAAAFVFACLIPSLAQANTINLTVGAGGVAGDHILGEVFTRNDFDQSGGQGAVDAMIINGLLAGALGTRYGDAPEYWRSSTDFGVLPAATAVGAGLYGNQTSFTLTQVFQYLVVGYDGPNGGSQAYYIGDLAIGDVINIVPKAYPDGVSKNSPCGDAGEPDCGHLVAGNYYGVTHSTFLNPGVTVPDGGMTIALLGMAMAGMGLAARRVK